MDEGLGVNTFEGFRDNMPSNLVAMRFAQLLEALSAAKPNDKSALDRYYAITITQVELAQGCFGFYVMGGDDD